MTNPPIQIDDRGKLCKALAMQMNIEPSRCEWDVMWDRGVIELKTAADLTSSIRNGHMQDQLNRLAERDDDTFLLVVGLFVPVNVGRKPCTLASTVFEDRSARTLIIPRRYKGTHELHTAGKLVRSPIWTFTNYLTRVQEYGVRVITVPTLNRLGNVVEHIVKRSRK